MTLDKFTASYIEAALWSSMDEGTPEGGEPMDANYDITDLAPETLERMRPTVPPSKSGTGTTSAKTWSGLVTIIG